MILMKKIGFGTIISLITAYVIYLYASEKGWKLLAFIAKAYLMVYLVIIAIIVGIVLIIILFAFAIDKKYEPKQNNKNKKSYIDAEYKIKE